MKKMTKIGASILASVALVSIADAASTGPYVGLGLGGSRINTPNNYLYSPVSGTTSRSMGGLGGRVFGGYNFNQYFGLEANYATYARSTYRGTDIGNTSASTKYTMSALDLVAKGYLPISDTGINAYVLGGLADVSSKVEYHNNGVPLAGGVSAPNVGSHTTNKLRPTYGLGASYDLTQHVSTNLEYSYIQGSGNVKTSTSATPGASLLTLNIAYNFG